uniref:Uncharacterized protein n=1 Tax=Ditylenchus dipsaci TaxID=166011 RepID=A0A915CNG3_9BILA
MRSTLLWVEDHSHTKTFEASTDLKDDLLLVALQEEEVQSSSSASRGPCQQPVIRVSSSVLNRHPHSVVVKASRQKTKHPDVLKPGNEQETGVQNLSCGEDDTTSSANKQLVISAADYVAYEISYDYCYLTAVFLSESMDKLDMNFQFMDNHCLAYNIKDKTIGIADSKTLINSTK